MVDIAKNTSCEAPVMVTAELLIREALSTGCPATAAGALMREYRLSRPEAQVALVMGLIPRVSMFASHTVAAK